MDKKKPLNKRQDVVLHFLSVQDRVSIGEIIERIEKELSPVSKITVNRDLKELAQLGLIVSEGAGRAVVYRLSRSYLSARPIDVVKYFEKEVDERNVQQFFNFDIFSTLNFIFTDKEKLHLHSLNEVYSKKIAKLPKEIVRKEFERLTIELSWKSSKIEGNTYSLLETELLIKERVAPKAHTKEETIMILNHKKALDYIRGHQTSFKKISLKKIEEIHAILTGDLGIAKNIRNSLVGITGTRYKPLDNKFQISEALIRACEVANDMDDPFDKAVYVMLMIAYIQPFVDGNKRTSRLIGNALLLAHGACPLSYRSIDELEYKKAVLLFYEQNNISYFKKLFSEQFKFVVENYFL